MPDLSDKVSELLPCPFCGGEVRLVEGDESAYIQCTQVKMHRAMFFSGDNNAADEVTEQWNRRTRPAASTKEGWQTMDSAPTNGTWFDAWREPIDDPDVFWRSRVTVRWWKFEDGDEAWVWPDDEYEAMTVAGREAAVAMIASGDCYESRTDFTHWKPLPIPPEVKL